METKYFDHIIRHYVEAHYKIINGKRYSKCIQTHNQTTIIHYITHPFSNKALNPDLSCAGYLKAPKSYLIIILKNIIKLVWIEFVRG